MSADLGFLVGGNSYVWSDRGLLRILELNPNDHVLGLDTHGDLCWSDIPAAPRAVSKGTFKRVLTETNEFLLPEASLVSTLEGVKSVADLTDDDRVEMFDREDAFKDVFEHMSKRKLNKAQDESRRTIVLNRAVAYVLGTQLLCKRYKNKIVMPVKNIERWKELAQIFDRAVFEAGYYANVYYGAKRSTVLVDSADFAGFVNHFLSDQAQVPRKIRTSPTEVLLEFFRGLFDSTLSAWDEGVARISTASAQDQVRRFIFNVAKLLRMVPYDVKVLSPSLGRRKVWLGFRVEDLDSLNLRNVSTTYSNALSIPETRKDYACVKRIDTFANQEVYFLPSESIHWNPVVDLALIHHTRQDTQI